MHWRLVILALIVSINSLWAQTDNEEFRSTWVITWEHISQYSSVAENQARVREIMDNHVAANMNAVLWQARQSGTAYYNSSFEPWGSYAGGADPGYDPLAYAIEQAHARGLELHAWFNAFQAASTEPGTPSAEHPEWVCRDQSNFPMTSYRALSPGLEEVREYLVDVAMEIVNNYDVDGLHLDYVRWNEYSSTFLSRIVPDNEEEIRALDQMPDEAALEALLDPQTGRYLYDVDHPYSGGTPAGYASWEEFWRSSVTDFVHTLHDSMQTQKPWVRLSVAALGKYNWSGWNGYNVVYQDAALWFNQGYIDQLTPMHYHWTTTVGFYDMLVGGSPYCWGDYIQPGVTAGRLFSVGPGSYRFDENHVWNRHPAIVYTCRSVPWVDGFQFFSYGSWQDYQYWPIAGDTFFGSKTKIRDTGIYVSETPVSPTIEITEVDPLSFDLAVTPDASVSDDQWWAVYRSQISEINVDEDEIIGIRFGSEPFILSETFDGTQDHNGSYFYSATMFDRYWNESLPTSSVESGILESFAPVAMEFYPEDGDTVDVNSVLSFRFSKTMDTESVESAFSISPPIEIGNFSWSESNHRLLVYAESNFEFLSTYIVTLSESALDINGVAFDGDADGEAGG
ncbi:family 10 glycosylhydrolase, partial [bacterium]|nr:family 10 glycosylhydrolase [bacterium]